MAEATRLCPACRSIMKPASYKVGKQNGTERIENKIYSWDGTCVFRQTSILPSLWKFSNCKVKKCD